MIRFDHPRLRLRLLRHAFGDAGVMGWEDLKGQLRHAGVIGHREALRRAILTWRWQQLDRRSRRRARHMINRTRRRYPWALGLEASISSPVGMGNDGQKAYDLATRTWFGTFVGISIAALGRPVYDTSNPNLPNGGAKGDFIADDTAAIQGAATASRTAAKPGGIVYSPAGTYMIDCTAFAPAGGGKGGGSEGGGVGLGSKTIFCGAGRGATIFKAKANNPVQKCMFMGWDSNDEADIFFSDFTIDGNGAVNTTEQLDGFQMWTGTRILWARIVAQNFRTTNANEKGAWNCVSLSFAAVLDCYVNQGGLQCNAFAFSACETLTLINCSATGVGSLAGANWRVFVCDGSQNVAYLNCFGYSNTTTQAVFDCNAADHVEYVNCTAGVVTLAQFQSFQGPTGFNVTTIYANAGWGFNIAGATHVTLERCKARNSTANGGLIIQGVVLNVRVSGGGDFSSNTSQGILLNSTSAWQNTVIVGYPTVVANGAANLYSVGNPGSYESIPGQPVLIPGFPATTMALQNPYAINIQLAITNGANAMTVALNNTTALVIPANGTATVLLPATATIKFTYAGGAPSWVWFVA